MIMGALEDTGLSHAVQDYLKAIYLLTRGGQPASTTDLAEALDIRSPSVTNMLQKLADTRPDLVTYHKHGGAVLTPDGEKIALLVIRRHRLLEQFLYEVLEYPLEKIHPEAERLEHAISPLFVEKISRILGEPLFDPHGHPIPDRDLNLQDARHLVPLSELHPGEGGTVRMITDQEDDLLVFLTAIGIAPGAVLRVVGLNPIDGTMIVRASSGDQDQALGRGTAGNIMVETG